MIIMVLNDNLLIKYIISYDTNGTKDTPLVNRSIVMVLNGA